LHKYARFPVLTGYGLRVTFWDLSSQATVKCSSSVRGHALTGVTSVGLLTLDRESIRSRMQTTGLCLSNCLIHLHSPHTLHLFPRPWHMVEYFRYIRFYPDGRLYFLTCAEKPIVTVGALTESSSKNPSLLKGTYRLYGDNVISASVRKSNPAPQIQTRPRPGKAGKQQSQDITEFHMDFEIQELKEKRNWVLCWTHYAVYINNANMRNNNLNNNGAHGGGITSTFELNPNKYPPLYFSRVKSYALNSESILE